ncbi:hypothetical protein DRQ09_01210 [candidate division KSB1 bacterium]|nr:MAG: hypothetical protein DRQ09_01210 [candidate division KSB1 bacterium]
MNLIQLKKAEIKLPEIKKDIPLEKSPEVEKLIINLKYGDSFDFQPIIKQGEKVSAGQIIARTENGFTLRAPLPGEISGIENRFSSLGEKTPAIILNVEKVETSPVPISNKPPEKRASEIINQLLSTGVNTPWTFDSELSGDVVKKVLINCVDEEPGFINNRMCLRNNYDAIIKSLNILKILAPVAKIYLAVDEADYSSVKGKFPNNVEVLSIPYNYLDRLEHYIVNRLLGFKRPAWKKYKEYGMVVIKAEDLLSVYNAIYLRIPNIKKRISVFSDFMDNPKYIEVFYGTPIRDILKTLNINVEEGERVNIGGPMKGFSQFDLDISLTMFSDGIYLKKDTKKSFVENYPCINCGSCTRICPENLQVHLITRRSEFYYFEEALKLGAGACIKCGLCSYVCPAHRPLVQYIKFALDEATLEKQNELEE